MVFLLLVATGLSIYLYLHKQSSEEDNQPITQDNFTLTYSYTGDNYWQYAVKGETPTPCYNITTDALVMESYPEQVKVRVTVTKDTSAEICTTVIGEYNYSGSFSASENATVSLSVENLK